MATINQRPLLPNAVPANGVEERAISQSVLIDVKRCEWIGHFQLFGQNLAKKHQLMQRSHPTFF